VRSGLGNMPGILETSASDRPALEADGTRRARHLGIVLGGRPHCLEGFGPDFETDELDVSLHPFDQVVRPEPRERLGPSRSMTSNSIASRFLAASWLIATKLTKLKKFGLHRPLVNHATSSAKWHVEAVS